MAARYARAVAADSPSLTSTSRTPAVAATVWSSIGISARQGGQYVAQKLITSGTPARSARRTVVPAVVRSSNAGAGRPPGSGDASDRPMVLNAWSTSGAPHPSPPDASCFRPCGLSVVTSEGGMSLPTFGAPRYTSRM